MNDFLVSNIIKLAERRGKLVEDVENELNFRNGEIQSWKNLNTSISKVCKVADYFGVTVDTLVRIPLSDDSLQHETIGSKIVSLILCGRAVTKVSKSQTMRCFVPPYVCAYDGTDTIIIYDDDSERSIRLWNTDKETLDEWLQINTTDTVLTEFENLVDNILLNE